MSTMVVNATYDHGVFRPDLPEALGLQNGQKVQVIVRPTEQIDAILDLAAEVYAGLGEDEIAALEQLIQRNEDFYRSTTDLRSGPSWLQRQPAGATKHAVHIYPAWMRVGGWNSLEM